MKPANLTEVQDFFNAKGIAIVGISATKSKFGNYIFKKLKQRYNNLFPVHRDFSEFQGIPCHSSIARLPEQVDSIILNTKPDATQALLKEALMHGIQKIWLQPGSDNEQTLEGISLGNAKIIRGECIIMHLEKPGFPHNLHRFFHVRKKAKVLA
jgi:uncharacterized protein